MKKLIILACFVSSFANAADIYKKPEKLIDDLVRGGGFSAPILNWSKTALVKAFYEELPSIGYVSRAQLKLGGLRFNPVNYTATINSYIRRLVYFDLLTKKEKEIDFPATAILREVSWSPDGKKLAVSWEKENCQEIWIVEIPSLSKKRIPSVCLNAITGRTVQWLDNDELFLKVRTDRQKNALKPEKQTPSGPVIQKTGGVAAQNRTYTDLLKTAEDAEVLAKALDSQLAVYNFSKGLLVKVGKPGLFSVARVSPNKKLILTHVLEKPFSLLVPYYYFAASSLVLDRSGNIVATVAKGGPFERIPIQGVVTGPRSIQWIPSEEQTLFYAEALDKGDWNLKVDNRDELFRAVVDGKHLKRQSFLKLKNRFAGIEFLDQGQGYLVVDYERDKERITEILVSEKDWKTKVIFSRNENDDYGDPGNPVYIRNKWGESVAAIDGKNLFLAGQGASAQGDLPFLRKINLETLETQELFRSQQGSYERFLSFLTDDFSKFMTIYETQLQSPQIYVRKSQTSTEKELLYADPNPYAIMSKIKKEIITYKRNDGVLLSAILYYPLDYEKGKKYPAIIQAYPLEYTDKSSAGQVRGSQDKFERPFREDIAYNALRGYVVLDHAQMPIIGHPETKNDKFIEQLVSGAKAAVKALADRDLVDTKRIGVIGHSYGAFMVAHLLTHSDLFATGIAKSGAYNRTLTPFGFQGERRPFWKAKETYLKMSPFIDADKVKKPILLMHGMADNNTGTFTLQSERYYEALKGQGAVAKLVLLPVESQGYASRES
ncbi:MAG: alpha/beta hydrolase family protein, partial [Pseudobdellovibrionaceae bacterium]